MSLEERKAIISEIKVMQKKTGFPLGRILSFAGLSFSTWNEWHKRQNAETRHNHNTPKTNWTTPEETKAVVQFCLENRDALRGYRYLAWQMIDLNIAAVYPSTVYNIMKRHGLFQKWAAPQEAKKKGFDQPMAPNEQWHTDYSYVRVCGMFFYFACILDGFSRKVLVWDLFPDMEAKNIEILVMRAKEEYPDAHARIIHDKGRQFSAKELIMLLGILDLYETSTSPFHPQSNGKVERFHSTLKKEEVRRTAYFSYEDAKEKMAQWIDYYNNERLHAANGYLTPNEVFAGNKEMRLDERRIKLHNASIKRKAYWEQQA